MTRLKIRGILAVAAAVLPALAGVASAASIYIDQAKAAVVLPIYADHTTSQTPVATVAAGTRLTLITGPYNGWWYGKVNGAATKGWFKEFKIARSAKSIPSGNRWVDVTIDDANKQYVARLMVGTTVVDEIKCGPGKPETPTVKGIFSVLYKDEPLFELPESPGAFLKCLQTFYAPGGKTLPYALHSWVLDKDGWPTTMSQFGRVSHGCVRLPRPLDVFRFTSLLTTVNIHYSPWRGATSNWLDVVKVATDESINVRSGVGTGDKIIGRVRPGQWYVTDRQSQGWYRIRFDSRYGWIWGGNLRRGSHATVRVKVQETRVRASASLRGTVIGKAYYGYRYAVADRVTGWTKIWFKGRTAWVYSANVVRVAF